MRGKFYQVKADGKVYPVIPTQKTSSGEVTSFNADKTLGSPTVGQQSKYFSDMWIFSLCDKCRNIAVTESWLLHLSSKSNL